ncbi:MAG: substrate-binding domain-containing protein [Pseudomonadota bacterium]|nr:substrate-binding domain-containing protein [Pseudomonadota bacterium]
MAENQPRKVTILDIAREMGVAPSTVSNALSGKRYVDPALVEKVKATAQRLGYRPNPVARRLRSGRASAIGLFSAMPFAVAGGSSRLGFMMEIAATAAEEAMRAGLALVLVPPVEAASETLIDDLMIDGALLVEPAEDDPFAARLEARGLPVMRIGRQPGRPEAPAVDLRSAETAELLLSHLADEGARNIALITGAARRNSHLETEAAYARFAEARGMTPIARRVPEQDGEAGGHAAGLALLKAHPELDAILAMVDVFAAGVCRAGRELGRDIPGDLKVATRYDGPRALASDPPLTAVALGLPEVARQAVAQLIPTLAGAPGPAAEGAGAGPCLAAAPDARLVIRASSRSGA